MWHKQGQGDHCDGLSYQLSLVAVISHQRLAKCGTDRDITVMDWLSKFQCKLSLVAVISNQHLAKCGSGRDREITAMVCLVKMSM